MGYENAKKALAASLERLQMDYVDLYMIHFPRQTGCRSARTASGLFAGSCRRILQSERYRSDGVEPAWQRPRKRPRR